MPWQTCAEIRIWACTSPSERRLVRGDWSSTWFGPRRRIGEGLDALAVTAPACAGQYGDALAGERDDEYVIELLPAGGRPPGAGRHYNETYVYAAFRASSARASRVFFANEPHHDRRPLYEAFGTKRISLGAGTSGFATPLSELRKPMPEANPTLVALLEHHVALLKGQRRHDSTSPSACASMSVSVCRAARPSLRAWRAVSMERPCAGDWSRAPRSSSWSMGFGTSLRSSIWPTRISHFKKWLFDWDSPSPARSGGRSGAGPARPAQRRAGSHGWPREASRAAQRVRQREPSPTRRLVTATSTASPERRGARVGRALRLSATVAVPAPCPVSGGELGPMVRGGAADQTR